MWPYGLVPSTLGEGGYNLLSYDVPPNDLHGSASAIEVYQELRCVLQIFHLVAPGHADEWERKFVKSKKSNNVQNNEKIDRQIEREKQLLVLQGVIRGRCKGGGWWYFSETESGCRPFPVSNIVTGDLISYDTTLTGTSIVSTPDMNQRQFKCLKLDDKALLIIHDV
ncbi:hypothetical protein L1887_06369 [Cichorium endivia]|nr:hypothetical protein L1887_06369 [Cichorium endivia]